MSATPVQRADSPAQLGLGGERAVLFLSAAALVARLGRGNVMVTETALARGQAVRAYLGDTITLGGKVHFVVMAPTRWRELQPRSAPTHRLPH